MKRYKSVEFLSNFRLSSPSTQTQSSPAETQSPPIENFLATVLDRTQWRVEGRGKLSDGPGVKRNFWLAIFLTLRHVRMHRVIF